MLRRSQIFMFDMILAIVVVVLILVLFFSYYLNVNTSADIYVLNRELLGAFSNTKINSLNDIEVIELFRQNKIKNVDNTVAQQVIEFFELKTDEGRNLSRNLTGAFAKDYLDLQMNFNITLENSSMVFVLNTTINKPSIKFEDASIASVSQKRIFAFKNISYFYGPYVFKVKIWK